jgi:hypothetical protein
MRPLQADPLGLGPDVNDYRWEGNGPTGGADPSGLGSFLDGLTQPQSSAPGMTTNFFAAIPNNGNGGDLIGDINRMPTSGPLFAGSAPVYGADGGQNAKVALAQGVQQSIAMGHSMYGTVSLMPGPVGQTAAFGNAVMYAAEGNRKAAAVAALPLVLPGALRAAGWGVRTGASGASRLWQGATGRAACGTPNVLSWLFGIFCFAAGTPLLTPEGDKPIEQIKPGDWVLSAPECDPEAPPEPRLVEEVFTNVSPLLNLRVGRRTIRTTPLHPFYVRGKGWTAAQELESGDLLRSHDGRWVAVESVAEGDRESAVYNLRISEHHTYFVGAREWGFSVWAHNACTIEAARAAAARHAGEEIGLGRFLFPTRRAARQAASEIAGDLGRGARRISQQEFDGLPSRLGGSDRTIGRQSWDGSVGWRDDWFGHPFDGRPHVNVWGPNGVELHLYYGNGGWAGLGFGRPWG